MEWRVEFYERENGNSPVMDFLQTLNVKMRSKAQAEIDMLEKHGTNLREPYVKPISGSKYRGLFELRIKFAGDISRIFYFTFTNNTFVLLHGFTKKTDKTPTRELDKAMRYKIDHERRYK